MNAPVQVSCDHRGRAHGHCMLERAECIAVGNADPWPCLACRSEWPLGRRPFHPAEHVREKPGLEEEDGRWLRTYEGLRLAMIVSGEPSQLDYTEYQSPGGYNTFGDMRAQGHCETAMFLLCTLP